MQKARLNEIQQQPAHENAAKFTEIMEALNTTLPTEPTQPSPEDRQLLRYLYDEALHLALYSDQNTPPRAANEFASVIPQAAEDRFDQVFTDITERIPMDTPKEEKPSGAFEEFVYTMGLIQEREVQSKAFEKKMTNFEEAARKDSPDFERYYLDLLYSVVGSKEPAKNITRVKGKVYEYCTGPGATNVLFEKADQIGQMAAHAAQVENDLEEVTAIIAQAEGEQKDLLPDFSNLDKKYQNAILTKYKNTMDTVLSLNLENIKELDVIEAGAICLNELERIEFASSRVVKHAQNIFYLPNNVRVLNPKEEPKASTFCGKIEQSINQGIERKLDEEHSKYAAILDRQIKQNGNEAFKLAHMANLVQSGDKEIANIPEGQSRNGVIEINYSQENKNQKVKDLQTLSLLLELAAVYDDEEFKKTVEASKLSQGTHFEFHAAEEPKRDRKTNVNLNEIGNTRPMRVYSYG
ncbi:MAG: hypothetical protein ACTSXQ_00035 [Alphaproteobacteria bacterium]